MSVSILKPSAIGGSRRKRWTAAEDAIIRQHYPGGGISSTRQFLPTRSVKSIQRRADQMGVFVRKPSVKPALGTRPSSAQVPGGLPWVSWPDNVDDLNTAADLLERLALDCANDRVTRYLRDETAFLRAMARRKAESLGQTAGHHASAA